MPSLKDRSLTAQSIFIQWIFFLISHAFLPLSTQQFSFQSYRPSHDLSFLFENWLFQLLLKDQPTQAIELRALWACCSLHSRGQHCWIDFGGQNSSGKKSIKLQLLRGRNGNVKRSVSCQYLLSTVGRVPYNVLWASVFGEESGKCYFLNCLELKLWLITKILKCLTKIQHYVYSGTVTLNPSLSLLFCPCPHLPWLWPSCPSASLL